MLLIFKVKNVSLILWRQSRRETDSRSLAYEYLIDVQGYHTVGKAFRIMEHNVYA